MVVLLNFLLSLMDFYIILDYEEMWFFLFYGVLLFG